jgi:spermidine/putrescine transport system ATP-binding protein
MLEIKNVCKRYGDIVACDKLDFTIEAGEFFSLVGTSGCGKTTLLRMISGLDYPDAGDILLDGKSLLHVRTEHRPFHTVFQNYALFPHLSVTDNIAFPLRMKGKSKDFIQHRVSEVLQLVALNDKRTQFPHALSGGQRQRVALGRAIADMPRVLLLDEPLAALDAKLREQMQVELIRLQKELAITFIFVTHSQVEALSLSHRIAVMNQGRIEQLDVPEHIYAYPKNRFVADFIGHCTLLDATVTNVGESVLELQVSHIGTVQTSFHSGAKVGQRGCLALRPEQIHIGATGAFPEYTNRVTGKVFDFLYIGDVTTYIVELADGTRIETLLANTLPGRIHFFEAGASVDLAWASDVGCFLYE